MLKELSSLYKVHDEIDAEVFDEHIVHGNNEWVVHLIQYLLLEV
jgi:hypothetical protein